MKLHTRLLWGFGAVLLVAAVGLLLGLLTALALASKSSRMADENIVGVEVASKLRTLTEAQQLLVTQRLLQPERPSAIGLMPDFERAVGALLDRVEETEIDADNEAALARARAALPQLRDAVAQADRRPADQLSLPSDVVYAFDALRAAALELFSANLDALNRRASEVHSQARQLSLALGLLAGFTVLIGVFASLRIARALSAPMERLARAAERLASRDFDIRIEPSGLYEPDLVAARFNAMVDALGRFHAMDLSQIVAERRRLDRVISSIDDGLVIFDEHGRIERVNPVAARQLGIGIESSLGRRLGEISDLRLLAQEVDILVAAPDAELEEGSDLVLGAGPEQRTLSYSLLPFADPERTGVILVLRDVSEERHFDRLRTEFVLRASHELRTPVTGMRMALGLLDGKLRLDERTREAELFATVNEEMQRLLVLLDALLDLSRLYARNAEIERRPIAGAELVRAACQRFQLKTEEAGLELECEISDRLPEISADADALARVFDNLLTNAIRHTPAGGRVSVAARLRRRGVEYSVTDTGEGIARAERTRVFEPFVQVGRHTGGAGLGLALCRELLQQHGVRLRVASSLGRGSRFWFVMPLG